MVKLSSTTSQQVIIHLKSIFARHGIPEVIRSNNGPHYSAYEFKTFANKYGFEHITSKPHYPQGNGEAESAVKTLKSILKKCHYSNEDIYLSLFSYWAIPLSNGYSPVQLLMRRKHRTPFPELSSNLKRYLPNENFVKEREEKHRRRNKKNRHGGTKNLEQLAKGQYV